MHFHKKKKIIIIMIINKNNPYNKGIHIDKKITII